MLNQELDNLIKRIVICQKIVRGYLCRKRLLTLLDLVQKQKEENIQFIQHINTHSLSTQEKMDQTSHIHRPNNFGSNNNNSNNHTNRNNEYKSRAPTQYPPPPPPPPVPSSNNKNSSSNDNYKIQNLKAKLENQMRTYAKQEEFDEMLKLAKVNIKSYIYFKFLVD